MPKTHTSRGKPTTGWSTRRRGLRTQILFYLLTLTLVFPPWVVAPVAEAAFNDETTTRLPAATDDAYGFAVADVDGVNGPDILLAGRGRIDSLLMTAAATSRMRPTRACRVTRR